MCIFTTWDCSIGVKEISVRKNHGQRARGLRVRAMRVRIEETQILTLVICVRERENNRRNVFANNKQNTHTHARTTAPYIDFHCRCCKDVDCHDKANRRSRFSLGVVHLNRPLVCGPASKT